MGGFMRGEGGAGFGAAGGGGGGGFGTLAGTAMICAAGNNTTGTVGDMSKPYTTYQAAYDDGARRFLVEGGYSSASAGGLTLSGNNQTLVFFSLGEVTNFNVGAIYTTGHSVTIQGNGAAFVKIDDINTSSATPGAGGGSLYISGVTLDSVTTAGAVGATNSAAGAAGNIYARNCDFVNTLSLIGGQGGNSNATASWGGTGGAGGAFFAYSSAFLSGSSVYTSGGNGGNGFDDDETDPASQGGAGGNAGEVRIIICTNYSGSLVIVADAGAGGAGGSGAGGTAVGGAGGAGGNASLVTLLHTEGSNAISADGGNGGAGGADGGWGAGADGGGGNGAGITIEYGDTGNIDASGGTGSTEGVGGTIALIYARTGTIANDGLTQGAIDASFSKIGAVSPSNAAAVYRYVTEAGTTYDTQN